MPKSCPFGFPPCTCGPLTGIKNHNCDGCQCMGKHKHMCRGRADAHFYPTVEDKKSLERIALQMGKRYKVGGKLVADPSDLIEQIVSEWLAKNDRA